MGKGEMYGIVGTSEITMGDYVSDFMKVTRSIRQGIFFTFVLYFLFQCKVQNGTEVACFTVCVSCFFFYSILVSFTSCMRITGFLKWEINASLYNQCSFTLQKFLIFCSVVKGRASNDKNLNKYKVRVLEKNGLQN